MDLFTRAYIEAALWSSTDDQDQPLDKNYSVADFAPETLAKMVEDCRKFQQDMGPVIGGEVERAGHDFWLTRNRHGAGFWDGDWSEPGASNLDTASKAFGEFNLYVGDDGRIYA